MIDFSPAPFVYDVFVNIGQSNLGTGGGIAPLSPYITPNPNCYIQGATYNTSGVLTTEFTSFAPIDYTTGNALGDAHGPELSMAYNHQKKFYIIKVWQGGSNLNVDWASGSDLRDKLIELVLKTKTDLKGYRIRWHLYYNQWEAEVVNTTWTNLWKANYEGLITEVFTDNGITLTSHLIAKVNPYSSSFTVNQSNGQIIMDNMKALATEQPATVLVFDDLPFVDDKHYTSVAQHEIGKRIIEAANLGR